MRTMLPEVRQKPSPDRASLHHPVIKSRSGQMGSVRAPPIRECGNPGSFSHNGGAALGPRH
jgi:hypothetical protein